MTQTICPHCGQSHPEGVRFCPKTGQTLSISPTCARCGESLEIDWMACPNCGLILKDIESYPPTSLPKKGKAQFPIQTIPVLPILVIAILIPLSGLGLFMLLRNGNQSEEKNFGNRIPEPSAVQPNNHPSFVEEITNQSIICPCAGCQEMFDLVGDTGGPITAITVHQYTVFAAVGARLVTLDLSDPNQPREITSIHIEGLPSRIEAIAIHGDNAYLIAGGKIWSINITQPEVQKVASRMNFSGKADRLFVEGNLLYVQNYNGLVILDISNPKQINQLGEYEPPEVLNGLFLKGNFAYVAASEAGLRIVDLSDPTNPNEVSSFSENNFDAQNVVVVGEYAYLDVGYDGTKILDVSDVSQITLVGEIDFNFAKSLLVKDNYLFTLGYTLVAYDYSYAALEKSSSIVILDVSDPRRPVEIAAIKPAYVSNTGMDVIGGFSDFIIGNDLAFVLGSEGMKVFDISSPNQPQLLSALSSVYWRARDIGIYNNLALISGLIFNQDEFYGGVVAIDVSNPKDPGLVGSHRMSIPDFSNIGIGLDEFEKTSLASSLTTNNSLSGALDISQNSGMAVVTNGVGFDVISGSEQGLVKLGAYAGDLNKGLIIDIALADQTAFILLSPLEGVTLVEDVSNVTLIAVDLSDPANPQEVDVFQLGSYSGQITINENYAYLPTIEHPAGFLVVDISDPNNLQEVSRFVDNRLRSVSGLVYSEKTVIFNAEYYSENEEGLWLVNVTDPKNPTFIAAFETSSYDSLSGPGMFISDRVLFIPRVQGIEAVDLLENKNPKKLSSTVLPEPENPESETPVSLIVKDDHAYVASEHGLFIFQLYEPKFLQERTDVRAGDTCVSPKDGMKMVFVPAGEFIMGSDDKDPKALPDEKPQHKVYLDAFWIDQTEVTNGMYALCVEARICNAPVKSSLYTQPDYYGNPEYANYPVINVNWNQAAQYCFWAGRRLPTEAEWEKTARGSEGWIYAWGNEVPTGVLLNFCDKNCELDWKDESVDDGYGATSPVGSYPEGASLYGALDMAGNVSEWIADWIDKVNIPNSAYYASSPYENPQGPETGTLKGIRGGAWRWTVEKARATARDRNVPHYYYDSTGFRCAVSPK
jgi:hypothetical protein